MSEVEPVTEEKDLLTTEKSGLREVVERLTSYGRDTRKAFMLFAEEGWNVPVDESALDDLRHQTTLIALVNDGYLVQGKNIRLSAARSRCERNTYAATEKLSEDYAIIADFVEVGRALRARGDIDRLVYGIRANLNDVEVGDVTKLNPSGVIDILNKFPDNLRGLPLISAHYLNEGDIIPISTIGDCFFNSGKEMVTTPGVVKSLGGSGYFESKEVPKQLVYEQNVLYVKDSDSVLVVTKKLKDDFAALKIDRVLKVGLQLMGEK